MKNTFRYAVAAGCALLCGLHVLADAVPGRDRPLKLLMIGNSFSQSNQTYMPDVAKSLDLKLDLGSLVIGGCTLQKHWEILTISNVVYGADYKPYAYARYDEGVKTAERTSGLLEVLTNETWDIVTVQQASALSFKPETYYPYGTNLVALIRELAPQAEVMVQETWSYSSAAESLVKWKITEREMYDRLHAAYRDFAGVYGLRIIPTGTAAELVSNRDSLFDSDNKHFGGQGKFLQALVFTAKVFGVDVRTSTYLPAIDGLTPSRAAVLRTAAMNAVNGRYVEAREDGIWITLPPRGN